MVQLFTAGDEDHPLGTLTYDWDTPVLFIDHLEGRSPEIERVSPPLPVEEGLLELLLFPFPVARDFVIRVDGRETERFTQHEPRS